MVRDSPEGLRLRDGREVDVRRIAPSDAPSLERGLAELSAESRYRRFLSPKNAFSSAELDHLTRVDHHSSEALVAVEPGTDHGLAVARYIADPDTPGTAEVAIVVADAWQGVGLGRALLERIAARAAEEGVDCFSATVLQSNHDVFSLLRRLGPVTSRPAGSGVAELRIQLGEQDCCPPVLQEALRAAARGELALAERTPPG